MSPAHWRPAAKRSELQERTSWQSPVWEIRPTAAIVTDNAEATAAALDGIGANYRVSTLNTVTLPHSPGSLAEFTRGLANDGVNLRSLYVLSISGDSAEVGYTTE